MYCVGLTGPIASGKSTVAALFADLGVDLINADVIAKQLTGKDQPALKKIIAHFGDEFLDTDGHLQRRMLRETIFQHPEQRIWLEQLLHPLIRQTIEAQIQIPPKLYYMIEIPLLTHKINYPYLNRILVVLTEPKIQKQRVIQRDQHTADQVENIFKAQADYTTYQTLADDIIMNTGNLEELQSNVLNLHRQYCINSTKS